MFAFYFHCFTILKHNASVFSAKVTRQSIKDTQSRLQRYEVLRNGQRKSRKSSGTLPAVSYNYKVFEAYNVFISSSVRPVAAAIWLEGKPIDFRLRATALRLYSSIRFRGQRYKKRDSQAMSPVFFASFVTSQSPCAPRSDRSSAAATAGRCHSEAPSPCGPRGRSSQSSPRVRHRPSRR